MSSNQVKLILFLVQFDLVDGLTLVQILYNLNAHYLTYSLDDIIAKKEKARPNSIFAPIKGMATSYNFIRAAKTPFDRKVRVVFVTSHFKVSVMTILLSNGDHNGVVATSTYMATLFMQEQLSKDKLVWARHRPPVRRIIREVGRPQNAWWDSEAEFELARKIFAEKFAERICDLIENIFIISNLKIINNLKVIDLSIFFIIGVFLLKKFLKNKEKFSSIKTRTNFFRSKRVAAYYQKLRKILAINYNEYS